jgi:hypothetical protein
MGTVEAVATPAATVPTHRFSFTGDVHRGRSQDSLRHSTAANDDGYLAPQRSLMASPARQSSRSSLLAAALPSAATEVTRSSYLTDGTGTSCISGLSDFPSPPTQTVVSSDRVEMLKSYFGDASSRPVSQVDGGSPEPSAASRAQPPVVEGPGPSRRLSQESERPASPGKETDDMPS